MIFLNLKKYLFLFFCIFFQPCFCMSVEHQEANHRFTEKTEFCKSLIDIVQKNFDTGHFEAFKKFEQEVSYQFWEESISLIPFKSQPSRKEWMVIQSIEKIHSDPVDYEGFMRSVDYYALYGDKYISALKLGNRDSIYNMRLNTIIRALITSCESVSKFDESMAQSLLRTTLENFIAVRGDISHKEKIENIYLNTIEKSSKLVLNSDTKIINLKEQIIKSLNLSGKPPLRFELILRATNLLSLMNLVLSAADKSFRKSFEPLHDRDAKLIQNSDFFQIFHDTQTNAVLSLLENTRKYGFQFGIFFGKTGTGKDSTISTLGKDGLDVADVHMAGGNLVQSFQEMLLAKDRDVSRLQIFSPIDELRESYRPEFTEFLKHFTLIDENFYFFNTLSNIPIPLINVLVICTSNFNEYGSKDSLDTIKSPFLNTIKFGHFNKERISSYFIPNLWKALLKQKTDGLRNKTNLQFVKHRLGDDDTKWWNEVVIKKEEADSPESIMCQELDDLIIGDIDMRALGGQIRKAIGGYIINIKAQDKRG